MQNNKKYKRFSINLLNGYIAFYAESEPNEVVIYSYNQNGETYTLHEKHYLNHIESRLLIALLSNPGQIISNAVLQQIGNEKKNITSNNLRQAILSLRCLFMDNEKPHRLIKNKPRVGYSLHNVVVLDEETEVYLSSINRPSQQPSGKHHQTATPAEPTTASHLYRAALGYSKMLLNPAYIPLLFLIAMFVWQMEKQSDRTDFHPVGTHVELINNNLKMIVIHSNHDNRRYLATLKGALKRYAATHPHPPHSDVIVFQASNSIQLNCVNTQQHLLAKNFSINADILKSKASVDELIRQCFYQLPVNKTGEA